MWSSPPARTGVPRKPSEGNFQRSAPVARSTAHAIDPSLNTPVVRYTRPFPVTSADGPNVTAGSRVRHLVLPDPASSACRTVSEATERFPVTTIMTSPAGAGAYRVRPSSSRSHSTRPEDVSRPFTTVRPPVRTPVIQTTPAPNAGADWLSSPDSACHRLPPRDCSTAATPPKPDTYTTPACAFSADGYNPSSGSDHSCFHGHCFTPLSKSRQMPTPPAAAARPPAPSTMNRRRPANRPDTDPSVAVIPSAASAPHCRTDPPINHSRSTSAETARVRLVPGCDGEAASGPADALSFVGSAGPRGSGYGCQRTATRRLEPIRCPGDRYPGWSPGSPSHGLGAWRRMT